MGHQTSEVPVDPPMDGMSKPGGQHLWTSIACQTCAKSTGAQGAACCLTGCLKEPQPDYQRVAQKWGRGADSGELY